MGYAFRRSISCLPYCFTLAFLASRETDDERTSIVCFPFDSFPARSNIVSNLKKLAPPFWPCAASFSRRSSATGGVFHVQTSSAKDKPVLTCYFGELRRRPADGSPSRCLEWAGVRWIAPLANSGFLADFAQSTDPRGATEPVRRLGNRNYNLSGDVDA